MTGATELAAGGLRRFLRRGWEYAAYAALTVIIALALVLFAWGVWEIMKFLWKLFVEHRWQISGVLALIAATAGAVWWIWPKTDRNSYPPRREAASQVVIRFGLVVSVVVLVGWSTVLLVQLIHLIDAVGLFITAISQGIYLP